MSFVAKLLQASQGNNLFLVFTSFPDGRDAWYYIRVLPAKVTAFHKAVANGPANLEEYGEILQRGWGKHPPAYVMQEMQEKYGFTTQ